MNFKKDIGGFMLALLLVLCSYFFLDAPIALLVKKVLLSYRRLSLFSSNIPDLLFPIVCVITGIAWAAYFYLVHKGIYDRNTRFFKLVAVAVPLAYVLKSLLKYAVGRINTKYWLRHPNFTEFHWFHGVGNYSGFPSGHMAVFTALVCVLWKFYPRYRSAYAGFLSVLALTLIATNYHFLSDVVAGAYVGFIVYYYPDQGLTFWLRSKEKEKTGDIPS